MEGRVQEKSSGGSAESGEAVQAPGVGLREGPKWCGRSSGSRDKGQVRDASNCSELSGGGGGPWRSRAAPFRSEAGLLEENGEGKYAAANCKEHIPVTS